MEDAGEPSLHYIEYYEHFLAPVQSLARTIEQARWSPEFVIGVGRGGLVPAVYLSHYFDLPMLSIDHSSKLPGFADELLEKIAGMSASGQRMLFVDDINDSGGTIRYICDRLDEFGCNRDNVRIAVMINNASSSVTVDFWAEMIDRNDDKRWFVFPWEAMGTRDAIVTEAVSVPERLG